MQWKVYGRAVAAACTLSCLSSVVRAEEGVVQWIGDVNTVWTANRGGDTNWNPVGTTDSALPGPKNVARFDGTAHGVRLPSLDDLRSTAGSPNPLARVWRTIEVPDRVTVRRIDFYDVAAGMDQCQRLRLLGKGPLVVAGDADGLAIDVTWQDTSSQGVTVGTDILVGGNVRIRRRAFSQGTGQPVHRNRNILHIDGAIGESVPGCRVEFDNEEDVSRSNPNHGPCLTLGENNSYSGGTILNGYICIGKGTPFGSGRIVDVATRRNTTLDVVCRVGAFSGGTRVLDHDFRMSRDDNVDREFRIRNQDCGELVLPGCFSGGDNRRDVLELKPGLKRRITLTGKNTYAASTIIFAGGTLRLAGSLACGHIRIGHSCRLEGDPDSPGTITMNIYDDGFDCINIWAQTNPNCPGGLLDARHLEIEIRPRAPLSAESYILVDYSTPGTGIIGSDNPATDGTFADARGVPEGYELIHDRSAGQVLLRRK